MFSILFLISISASPPKMDLVLERISWLRDWLSVLITNKIKTLIKIVTKIVIFLCQLRLKSLKAWWWIKRNWLKKFAIFNLNNPIAFFCQIKIMGDQTKTLLILKRDFQE